MKKIEWSRAQFFSKEFFPFIKAQHPVTIWVSAAFLIGVVLACCFLYSPNTSDILGLVLTMLNMLAIAVLWLARVIQQWRESLPLYEIAVLEDEQGKPLMMVSLIPLISESDARAQMQTALNVWNKAEHLPLKQWVSRRIHLGEWFDRNGVFNEGRPVRLVLAVIRKTEDEGKAQWRPRHPAQPGRANVYLAESHALREVPDQPIRLPHADVRAWYEKPQSLELELDNGTPQQL